MRLWILIRLTLCPSSSGMLLEGQLGYKRNSGTYMYLYRYPLVF